MLPHVQKKGRLSGTSIISILNQLQQHTRALRVILQTTQHSMTGTLPDVKVALLTGVCPSKHSAGAVCCLFRSFALTANTNTSR